MGRHKKYLTEEKRKAARAKYMADYYQANKKKIADYYQANKEKKAEYNAEYYQANKEKYADYYQTNRDKIAEYQADYYQANKDKIVEYNAEYYQTNKEKIVEHNTEYRKAHKDKYAEYNAEYYKTPMGRAANLVNRYKTVDKKYNRGECTLTARWVVDNIFTKPCHYCGESDWTKIGCDRIDNSKPHTPDNVVPCCGECNIKRNRKNYEEFKLMIENGEIKN